MSKETILIVDDAEINRMTLTAMFEDEYDLLEAADGIEALKVLEENYGRVAMILLDLIMPNMDGLTFLKLFRQNKEYEAIPVLLITASTDTSIMHKALDYGILDTIQKPFDPDITQKRVRNLINLYRARAAEEQMEGERKVTQAKARFLANMSHEIRTPMNAVRGMAEIGLNESDPEEKDQCFSQICSASDNLLSIINDILDFSKLSSGKYEISEEEYTITSLINDVVNIINARLGDKDIEFLVEADPATPCVLVGDPDRIRQIILNLANNAVKFTKEGYVKLKIWSEPDRDGTMLCAVVEDTGIGIKEEDRNTIFNAFVQVDNRYTKTEAGTGLGLAISQQLTALMNGTLTMESVYGQGSTFTLRVPQKVADAEPCAILPKGDFKVAGVFENMYVGQAFAELMEQLKVAYTPMDAATAARKIARLHPTHVFTDMAEVSAGIDSAIDGMGDATLVYVSKGGENHHGANRRTVSKPLYFLPVIAALNNASIRDYLSPVKSVCLTYNAPDAKILLVDDNIVNLRVAEGHMKPYGIKPKSVTSGKEAIAAVRREDFDMILMDHMMPMMDGIETTKLIRAIGGSCATMPIIALTATAIKGAREMFLSNGFNDFITKPMSGRDLAEIIYKWLPKEKVLDCNEDKPIDPRKAEEEEKAFAELKKCRGIDIAAAREITGGYANLVLVIRDFCGQIYLKSHQIEKYAAQENFEAYTIEVHALKTLARTIGAKELGEQAAYLEACGRRGETAEIRLKTPALIDKYVSYGKKLKPVAGECVVGELCVSARELSEELVHLRKALKEYDIDTADEWAEHAGNYMLDAKKRKQVGKILASIRNVDYIGAIKHIDEMERTLE